MNAIDILKDEHRVIEQGLRCLDGIADKWNTRHELVTGIARQIIDFLQHYADGSHHHKEEELLFPRLESRGILNEGGPIGSMLSEHVTGRTLIRDMISAIENYEQGYHDAGYVFVEASRKYIPLLKRHIAKEDHGLFEIASRVLLEQDQQDLMCAFASDEANRPKTHAYYHQLVDDLSKELGLPALSTMNKSRSACSCMDFMNAASACS